jgi:hypothetical protein
MAKNTTLNRKPSNDMRLDSGKYMPRARANQSGDGADFAFNGQMGNGVNRDSSRDGICVNQYAHLVRNPDRINEGMKASSRRGNTSDQSVDRMPAIGASVTKDKMKMTIATAAQAGGCIDGGRDWMPSAGQNYRGNPDVINMGMKK